MLESWNDGPAKNAIVAFVRKTTDPASPDFVPVRDRIATFDQDGTMWVEQPLYTQFMFALHRLAEFAAEHPEWTTTEPFKAALARDLITLGNLPFADVEALVNATHTGMSTDVFEKIVRDWVAGAIHPRWNRKYTELIYQPMLEVMDFLRANDFRVYMVTGGGQAFVRAFAEDVYGLPPEHVIGSSYAVEFGYDAAGKPVLMRPAKLLLFNDTVAKPQDIYLFLGRPPLAAFGNSAGDKPMLEYTQSGSGPRLMCLVQHDDAEREYDYGPGVEVKTTVGTFTQALADEAKANGWLVISMKNDWNRIFSFEPPTLSS